jgi:hypothetical protein
MMVAISLIGIVIGLLHNYHLLGWKFFNKAFGFSYLQVDARSALELLSARLRETGRDLIFTNDSFNPNVPLPKDAVIGKPYIYFAKPNIEISDDKDHYIKNYDYYLYYVAKAKNNEDNFSEARTAKLKMLLIKNQPVQYTESDVWPLMPFDAVQGNGLENNPQVSSRGLIDKAEYQDLSPEFSLYDSNLFFDFFNGEDYSNLFRIEVNLVDIKSGTKTHFETAVSPRN